jgi:hypothetical protein
MERDSSPITADPAETGLEPAGDGRMWLDRGFRGGLECAGLGRFDKVMAASEGRCLRVLDDRENWYLRVADAHRPPRGMYLKKHRIRTWMTWLRARLGLKPAPSAGRLEAYYAKSLAGLGVEVMRLVAYGEQLHADGLLESFLLTEELEGYAELQDLLRRQFSRRPSWRGRRLARLVRQVAEIARRFHSAGYTHRDFYCCHFLARPSAAGEFDLRLIDLQRMRRRRWFLRRWIIKDLAQLAWSAPRDRIGCRQRLAFMRHYLGVRKLRPCDKRLIRAVLRKQCFMEWQLGVEP